MVESILTQMADGLQKLMPWITKADGGVIKTNEGQIISPNGEEREELTMNDITGPSIYIRQTKIKTATQTKRVSSCKTKYAFTAPCRLVFYCFNYDKEISTDKMETILATAMDKFGFDITITRVSSNLETIFFEETNRKYEGGQMATLVAIDFDLSYNSSNCDPCDFVLDDCLI